MPHNNENLYIYLAFYEHAISAVFVREKKGKQFPVYYISKAILDAETWYSQLENLALTLVTADRNYDLTSRAILLSWQHSY